MALTVLTLLSLRVLSTHAWDPLAFVLLTPADAAPGQTSNIGYDGRFVYHIAVNDFGDTTGLDEAAFRYQRIFYPLLVKILSLGQPAWVPWVMLAVNLAAAVATTALLGRLLERRRVNPWWALVLVFSLGYLIALRLDLLEPLALALLLAGLLAYERERPVAAALWLCLATLTKELALAAIAALVVFELLRRDWRRAALFALAALPYLAWSWYLAATFGVPPAALEKSSLLFPPFTGFFAIADPISQAVVGIWAVVPAMGFGAWAAVDVVRRKPEPASRRDALLLLASAGLLSVLPAASWVDPLAVLRWGLAFLAMLLLWLAGQRPRLLPYVAALWLPSGLILAAVPGLF